MISIIIPVHNGEKTIGECIDSLLNQTRKPDEIIVIDDGSEDNTKKILKKIKGIKLLEQGHKGPAAARNLGTRKARGEIVLFTDSDCTPDRNWVSEMMKPFEDKKIVGVQGVYRTRQKDLVARFTQLEIEDRYDRMRKREDIDFIGSYSAGYRRKIFLKFGGFDESFTSASGEDPELSFKISKAGHRMVFNEKAAVYHKHVDSLSAYLTQKFWRAYWRVLLYRKHPGKMTNESYTPHTLKLQIISLCLLAISCIFSFFISPAIYASVAFLSILILLTVPLSAKNFKTDKLVGISTPVILVLRTMVFASGLIYGVLKL